MNFFTTLSRIKQGKDSKKSISATYQDVRYQLIPLTIQSIDDTEIISLLTAWRKKHEFWFPAQFRVTVPGTRVWLAERVLNVPDRILFMIRVGGTYIGHVGLFRYDNEDNTIEIDNIVRGEPDYPGIMTHALTTLMTWGKTSLGLADYRLQTASDNDRALRLYTRLGFRETKRTPMLHVKTPGGWQWEDAPMGYKGKITRYNVWMKRFDVKEVL